MVEVLSVHEGQGRMDMAESEVVAMVDKVDRVDEADTKGVLLDQRTLGMLGISLAVNGGEASDFQTAAEVEVVVKVLGEAIDHGLEPGITPHTASIGGEAGWNEVLPQLSLNKTTTAHSRCWVQEQEQDYRLKQVLKEAVFSVEKPDRFHFLSKRRHLGCGGRLSTGFGGGQQHVAYRMIKPTS